VHQQGHQTLQELSVRQPDLHLQYHPAEEGLQGKPRQSPVRTPREPTKLPARLWLSAGHVLRWALHVLRACPRSTAPGPGGQLPRLLLRQHLPLHSRTAPAESARGGRDYGLVDGDVLPYRCALCLRHDSGEHEGPLHYAVQRECRM
jgi:hypothetical protein